MFPPSFPARSVFEPEPEPTPEQLDEAWKNAWKVVRGRREFASTPRAAIAEGPSKFRIPFVVRGTQAYSADTLDEFLNRELDIEIGHVEFEVREGMWGANGPRLFPWPKQKTREECAALERVRWIEKVNRAYEEMMASSPLEPAFSLDDEPAREPETKGPDRETEAPERETREPEIEFALGGRPIRVRADMPPGTLMVVDGRRFSYRDGRVWIEIYDSTLDAYGPPLLVHTEEVPGPAKPAGPSTPEGS